MQLYLEIAFLANAIGIELHSEHDKKRFSNMVSERHMKLTCHFPTLSQIPGLMNVYHLISMAKEVEGFPYRSHCHHKALHNACCTPNRTPQLGLLPTLEAVQDSNGLPSLPHEFLSPGTTHRTTTDFTEGQGDTSFFLFKPYSLLKNLIPKTLSAVKTLLGDLLYP